MEIIGKQEMQICIADHPRLVLFI